MSDGCTMWMDGWPVWLGGSGAEWLHCCQAHDLAYESGAVTLQAHLDLGACVAQTGGGILLGLIMTAGTTLWWLVTRRRR